MRKRLVAIALLSTMLLSGCEKADYWKKGESLETETEVDEVELTYQAEYTDETVYDGAELFHELYEIPFEHDDDWQYTSNKDFVAKMDAQGKDVTPYIDYVKSYYADVYGQSYRDIANNKDEYMQTVISYLGGVRTDEITRSLIENNIDITEDNKLHIDDLQSVTYTAQEYAEVLAQAFTDNRLVLDCNVITDKSLVFERNMHVYVRVALEVHVLNGTTEDISIFGDSFDGNDGIEVIDLCVTNDTNKWYIGKIQELGVIEDYSTEQGTEEM